MGIKVSPREWVLLGAALLAGFGGGVLGGNVTTSSTPTSSHARFASSSGGGSSAGRIPTEGSTVGGEKSGEKLEGTGKLTTCYGWESCENAKFQRENDAFGYRALSKAGSAIAFTATTEVGKQLKSISINTSAFVLEAGGGAPKPRINCGTKIPANDNVNLINSANEIELSEAGTEAGTAVPCTLENATEQDTATGAWADSALKGGNQNTADGHESMHNSVYASKDTCNGYRSCASIGTTGGEGKEDTCEGWETCKGITTTSSNNLWIGTNVNPFTSGAHSNIFALGSGGALLLRGTFAETEAGDELKVLPLAEGKLSFYNATPIAQPHVGAVSGGTLAEDTTLVNKIRAELIALGEVRE